MRMRMVALGLTTVLAWLPGAAGAEWLSLRDGNLIETKGPWKEKGKMVVYTSGTGVLISVRASEVDLAMSQAIGARLQKSASYVDFGAAPDPSDPTEHHEVVDERGNLERSKLQHFVQDPNAPRVAGTLSASSAEQEANNLAAAHRSAEEASYRQEVSFCAGRFEGSTSTYSVCLLRAAIASDSRQGRAEAEENAFVEAAPDPAPDTE